MGYTAQFGNGFSATIAAEAPRKTQILVADRPAPVLAHLRARRWHFQDFRRSGAYGGFQVPDIVANLRVDQAWGSAQIMGAFHEVNPAYYVILAAATALSTTPYGGPDNKAGWVVGAGFKLERLS